MADCTIRTYICKTCSLAEVLHTSHVLPLVHRQIVLSNDVIDSAHNTLEVRNCSFSHVYMLRPDYKCVRFKTD